MEKTRWDLHLAYFDIVYGKVGVWMRLRGVQDLQYGDRSKCIFSICALGEQVSKVSAERKRR